MMNGIGYCLEAGAGQPDGVPLYIDFAGQCGGTLGQVWRYNGTTGHLSSLGTVRRAGRAGLGRNRGRPIGLRERASLEHRLQRRHPEAPEPAAARPAAPSTRP